jgi:hypothetical protein
MKKRFGLVILATATLLAAGTTVGTAWARGDNLSQPHSPAVLGEEQVKQLILLLDQNGQHQGTVSKEELMKFVSSEFDRLEHDRSGSVRTEDVQEPAARQGQPVTFSSAGK